MMWRYGTDPVGWAWMGVMMLIFWGAIVALVVFAIRAFRPDRGGDAAMDILRHRLASGEISPEEFEKTKRALQG